MLYLFLSYLRLKLTLNGRNVLRLLLRTGIALLALASVVSLQACSPDAPTARVGFTSSPSQDLPEWERLYKALALPTVMIKAPDGSMGSGVFIAPTRVLTAWHVVSDRDGNPYPANTPLLVDKAFQNGDQYLEYAKVILSDKENDLAILETVKKFPFFAAVASREEVKQYLRWGTPVWLVGHPLGVRDATLTEGRVSDTDDEGYIRHTALSIFGNSGGPLFIQTPSGWKVAGVALQVYGTPYGPVCHLSRASNPFATIKLFERLAE